MPLRTVLYVALIATCTDGLAMDTMKCKDGWICKDEQPAMTAVRTSWEPANLDLHAPCDVKFAHYPKEIVCNTGRLSKVRYKVTYTVANVVHQSYVALVPAATFPVDAKGEILDAELKK